MQKETIQNAKTIALAIEAGAKELGVPVSKVQHIVMEEPRKGILGIGAVEAIVKVFYEPTPVDKAEEFIRNLLKNMAIDAQVEVKPEDEEGTVITINGEGLGLLIGHHGEVLDSIQYLTSLAANKDCENYYRVNVDVENYREKRKETLKQLATRMAEKALKYNRSFALEPMSSYERRIIHSTVQEIPGVNTYSVGNDAERKVIIAP
ncbi:MAG: RNA-binding cell elongation regulator Jag/EloR, partial [Clostridia bacterium]